MNKDTTTTEAIPTAKLVPFKPFKGDLGELVHDRVKLNPESASATLDQKTTLEEFVPIMGSFIQMEKKTGFVIGDLYNQGFELYGAAMNPAMSQTGLAPSTLEVYARISKKVLPSQRLAALSFSHYQVAEPLLTEDKTKALQVLKEAATGGETVNGEAPKPITVAEMKRVVAATVTPKPKKPDAKKPGRAPKAPKAVKAPKEAKYRKLTAEEQPAWAHIVKNLLPKACEGIFNLQKALKEQPTKKDGLAMIEAIKQGPMEIRKKFITEAPAKEDALALFKTIQAVADRAGY